jgi:hypothetical protein
MFVSNKRIELPCVVLIGQFNVAVVGSFKLLGVMLDNKLEFTSHVSNMCLNINKKLFSIKRLFYLCTSVKIQFFKTFILPYFDYCLSLCIYFSKAVLQKLSNFYYLTLFKLFDFDFVNLDVIAINNFLEKYGLSSLHNRIVMRLSTFIFKIVSEKNGPLLLRDSLQLNSNRNLPYNLRNNSQFYQTSAQNNKFGDLTFTFFFTRFINKLHKSNIYCK